LLKHIQMEGTICHHNMSSRSLTCISKNGGDTEYCFCELWFDTNDFECCYHKLLRIRDCHSVNQTLLNLIIFFFKLFVLYDNGLHLTYEILSDSCGSIKIRSLIFFPLHICGVVGDLIEPHYGSHVRDPKSWRYNDMMYPYDLFVQSDCVSLVYTLACTCIYFSFHLYIP
jgi:hypothetical protein